MSGSFLASRSLAAGAWLITIACGVPISDAPVEPAAWTLEITPATLTIPEGSSEPQLTVSPQGAIVSWIEDEKGMATVRFAERTAAGWSKTQTVVSGNNWFRSYADMPAVLRLSNGTLVANWLPATDLFIEAYDLYLAYSTDDGTTWSKPFTPHHDGTTTQHGFASIFERPNGGVGLVWLDGRQQELDLDSPKGGAMSLRFAAFDTEWRQTANMLVDSRVCECCPTTVGLTSEGVITAYRNRTEAEIRDIHVSRLIADAWTSSTAVHNDEWEIEACPVNGPMLSTRGNQVVVTWFTAAGEETHAYAAFSDDGGQTFKTPIPLNDASTLGRTGAVLLPDGSAAVSWLEYVDNRAQLRIRQLEPSGKRSPAVVVAGTGTGRPTGFPRLALFGDRLIIAWTETTPPGEDDNNFSQIRVRVAEALLPEY